MSMEMSHMQRICNKGYGWYVAAKVVKAVCAVPAFLLLMIVMPVLAFLLAVRRAIECLWSEFLADLPSMVAHYWKGRWFSGFSRKHWASLYRKPKPTRITAHLGGENNG